MHCMYQPMERAKPAEFVIVTLFDLDIYSQEEKETSKSKSILDEIFRKKTREEKLSKEDNIRLTKTIRKITNR